MEWRLRDFSRTPKVPTGCGSKGLGGKLYRMTTRTLRQSSRKTGIMIWCGQFRTPYWFLEGNNEIRDSDPYRIPI